MSASKIAAFVAAALIGSAAAGLVSAKLPAPSDEQKARAAEAKAKADDVTKKDGELLAKSQDRAVERYKLRKTSIGKP